MKRIVSMRGLLNGVLFDIGLKRGIFVLLVQAVGVVHFERMGGYFNAKTSRPAGDVIGQV